ncbi:unnamed protein product [[Candida] boidinii]|nr:unnamed protein product [[Candida] boidinii]
MNPQFPTERDQHMMHSNMESAQFHSQQQQQQQQPPVYGYANNISSNMGLPQQQNHGDGQFANTQNDQHYMMNTRITEVNENNDIAALNQIKEMTDFSKLDKFKLNPQNIVSEINKYTGSEPQFDKFFNPLDENSPKSQNLSPPLQEQQSRQQSIQHKVVEFNRCHHLNYIIINK